jgi:hypothetical protein
MPAAIAPGASKSPTAKLSRTLKGCMPAMDGQSFAIMTLEVMTIATAANVHSIENHLTTAPSHAPLRHLVL